MVDLRVTGGKLKQQIEELVAGFEQGLLDRTKLVDQLAAIAGVERQRRDSDPTFQTYGLNHVALSVSDVGEMAEFMGRHLGTSVIRANENAGFLACGANNFVGLFKAEPTGLNHVCFTVEDYEPDDAVARLEAVGLTAHQNEDRVFFKGPDGIVFQVASFWGDLPTPEENG